MTTLEEFRHECGWSKNEMARQTSMDFNTLNRAINGEQVSMGTADKIATAISRKLGRTIRIRDIEGLNVKM
jgi:plasmid maintenance system antidote protein VapI